MLFPLEPCVQHKTERAIAKTLLTVQFKVAPKQEQKQELSFSYFFTSLDDNFTSLMLVLSLSGWGLSRTTFIHNIKFLALKLT